MLDTRFGKRPVTKNSANSTIAEIEKVCIEGLKGSEKIPQVGMALSMLGSVLDRFIKMSENKSECLEVLRRMLNLGKQIVQLNEQIPEQKEKLNEGVQSIIEGTIMCISQLAKANIFGFLTAQVSEKSLKDFQIKIDRLYTDIHLSTTIDMGKRIIDKVTDIEERVTNIGDRVPNIGSDSQKIYDYKQTVGIESAQDTVIELLDLNAQDPTVIVVVVFGFGGIGKTTLADAVYAHLNVQSYRHCRIRMEQDCTSNDLKGYQEQILKGLFGKNLQLKNCDEGRARLSSSFKENIPKQPLFLYIDNGLKSTDLEKLLPEGLGSCLPSMSRILITTRNLNETGIFFDEGILCRHYDVNPLPETEARKLLLRKVSDYNDENNIQKLLGLCGGVPLLLQLAGSQLVMNPANRKNIVLEMLQQGKEVKDKDLSDRMVGFVYDRLLSPVQEAFLDLASYFYKWRGEVVASIVGEEEFRALEAASFVKTSEDGLVIVHDIVRARGKKLSEQEGNRITDRESLLECLKNDEKLKKLKGIYFHEESEQPPIEINCHHLNCMSNSLKVLRYRSGSQITIREKCQKPFEQLRCLTIDGDVPDLPMELEKLEHLVYYSGPMTQGMNLYEFLPSLRYMFVWNYSEDRVAYSKIPPKVTPHSSLVSLGLYNFKNMQSLPDGVEKLTKLERLSLWECHELRELPSKLGDLSNLKELRLVECNELKELPSKLGDLSNLKELRLIGCNELKELPSNFGQLSNLTTLRMRKCSALPSNLGQLTNLEELDLSFSYELAELPSDIGQLQNLRKLKLRYCSKLEEWPLSFADLTKMKEIDLRGCSSKLKDSLPENIKRNNCTIWE